MNRLLGLAYYWIQYLTSQLLLPMPRTVRSHYSMLEHWEEQWATWGQNSQLQCGTAFYKLGIVPHKNSNWSSGFQQQSLRVENTMYCSEPDLEERDRVVGSGTPDFVWKVRCGKAVGREKKTLQLETPEKAQIALPNNGLMWTGVMIESCLSRH